MSDPELEREAQAHNTMVNRWKDAIEASKRARAVSPAQVFALPAVLALTIGIIR